MGENEFNFLLNIHLWQEDFVSQNLFEQKWQFELSKLLVNSDILKKKNEIPLETSV